MAKVLTRLISHAVYLSILSYEHSHRETKMKRKKIRNNNNGSNNRSVRTSLLQQNNSYTRNTELLGRAHTHTNGSTVDRRLAKNFVIETATRERKKSKIISFKDEAACVWILVSAYRIPFHRRTANGARYCSSLLPLTLPTNRNMFNVFLYYFFFASFPSKALVWTFVQIKLHFALLCKLIFETKRDKKWNHFINFHFIHHFVDTHTHPLLPHGDEHIRHRRWNKLEVFPSLVVFSRQIRHIWMIDST